MSQVIKTIGVMDSGFGGLALLSELANANPGADYIYYGDLINSPYGNKSTKDVIQLTENIVQYLIHENVDAILLACNTATSAAALELRSRYSIPIFGMEPALKPAVLENPNQNIAVFATSLTLKEEKFSRLEKSLGAGNVLHPINCDGLAALIDKEDIVGCVEFLDPILLELKEKNINIIVLGCTHYLLIRPLFSRYNRDLKLYDGNLGTIRYITGMLSLPEIERESRIELVLNGGSDIEFQIAYRYLNFNPREETRYVK